MSFSKRARTELCEQDHAKCLGREFHVVGPATEKVRRPYSVDRTVLTGSRMQMSWCSQIRGAVKKFWAWLLSAILLG